MQCGTCVLIGDEGYVLTTLHIVQQEVEKGKGKVPAAGRSSTMKASSSLQQIWVILPNATAEPLTYAATMMSSSPNDDLALLRASVPIPKELRGIKKLSRWLPYHPHIGDSVIVLSFPAGKGEDRRISHNASLGEDFPWMGEGTVSCVNGVEGQAFALYSTFAGSSRALVVHPAEEERYLFAIHLGTFHESAGLRSWSKNELDKLNERLGEKTFSGYFTFRARELIDRHFRCAGSSGGMIPSAYLHPQVAVKRKKNKRKV